ncbi:MAG TPA: hypothetical protein VI007_07800 [bacterium]
MHPRQSDVYRLAREVTKGEMSTDTQGFLAGAAITAATLLDIAASTPYWRALGLLGRQGLSLARRQSRWSARG